MLQLKNTPQTKSMSLLREVISEIVKLRTRKLRVFDFDDTLCRTKSKVGVKNTLTGEHFWLVPGQFAVYEKQENEVFDFSDFDKLVDPTTIHWTGKILGNIYSKYGPSGVVILTARQEPGPVEQFLNDAGFPGIEVVACASANPQVKADWIEARLLRDDLHLVEFFDDSHKNIAAVKELQVKHPDVKIIVRHIVHRNDLGRLWLCLFFV